MRFKKVVMSDLTEIVRSFSYVTIWELQGVKIMILLIRPVRIQLLTRGSPMLINNSYEAILKGNGEGSVLRPHPVNGLAVSRQLRK